MNNNRKSIYMNTQIYVNMETTARKSIKIPNTTRDRIRNKQRKGESVNMVLSRLLDKYEGFL